ncbi:MAG: hypothetical protein OXE98_06045 [Hyphomicrobiales bacterium]|nr:hypothetical protein [Hyphomicrobiales bacterium]
MNGLKTFATLLPMTLLLACGGGGGGYSGSIPEPIAFTKASDVKTTEESNEEPFNLDQWIENYKDELDQLRIDFENENDPKEKAKLEKEIRTRERELEFHEQAKLERERTPPTPEERRANADRRKQEAIEERRNKPTPWEKTYYKTELENAIKDLQDAINYGYEEDSAHVQNPKNRIAKYTKIKELYQEWLITKNQDLRDQINEIRDSRWKEWQKEFGYVDSPEQTEDLRKYNKQYQHLAFNEWLGNQPDLKRDYYLKEDGVRIGSHEGRTKYLPTSNLTYTGKYLGFSQNENLLEIKGDLTAEIKGESFNIIDFTFKGLNVFLGIGSLLEHEHYDFGTVVYDENGKNPVLKSPTITGGKITGSDIIIEGKIWTGPVVNGKTQSSGAITGRIKSDDRNLRLEAVMLGNNHEGIVGHINRGAATNGNLELRFGAEKE